MMMMIILFVYILDVLFNKKAYGATVVLCKGVNEMTYVITILHFLYVTVDFKKKLGRISILE